MSAMRDSRMRVLVGYAHYTDRLSYYDDWLDAFTGSSRFEAIPLNVVASSTKHRLPGLLRNVDAVVLLHSTNGDTVAYLEPHAEAFARRNVPLLTFVGNEVNIPGSPIADKRRLFKIIKPDYIATQLLLDAGRYLFDDVARRGVVAIPHALNTAAYRPVRSPDGRQLDIGARAARYLPHLGDNDRNRLLQWFGENGPARGLNVEISDKRLDRKGWAEYLNNCKATVATEAGGWFLEKDDATVNAIREHILSNSSGYVIKNDSAIRWLGHRMPWWVRSMLRSTLWSGPIKHEAVVNERIDSDKILHRFFAGRERPPLYSKCISSRHFDAAGTKTCQIMFRGRFNDILVADEHYIALESDFSNIETVLATFHDSPKRQEIAERAYDLVLSGHTYPQRMQQIYELLSAVTSK
jgi:hypothetical protein